MSDDKTSDIGGSRMLNFAPVTAATVNPGGAGLFGLGG